MRSSRNKAKAAESRARLFDCADANIDVEKVRSPKVSSCGGDGGDDDDDDDDDDESRPLGGLSEYANMDPTKLCSIVLVQSDSFDQHEPGSFIKYSDYEQQMMMYNSMTFSSSLSSSSSSSSIAIAAVSVFGSSQSKRPLGKVDIAQYYSPQLLEADSNSNSNTMNLTDIYRSSDSQQNNIAHVNCGVQALNHSRKLSRERWSQKPAEQSLPQHSGERRSTECRSFIPGYVSTMDDRFIHAKSEHSSLSFSSSNDSGVFCSSISSDNAVGTVNTLVGEKDDVKVGSSVYDDVYSDMNSIESDTVTLRVG